MRVSVAVLLAVLASSALSQESSKSGAAGTDADREQVRKFEQATFDLYKSRDEKGLAALLADSFVCVEEVGKQTKKEFLDEMMNRIKIETFGDLKMDVVVYGDSAVTTGTYLSKGTYDGKPYSQPMRFTDIVVRKDGRWLQVATHLCNAVEAKPEAEVAKDVEKAERSFFQSYMSRDEKAITAALDDGFTFVNEDGTQDKRQFLDDMMHHVKMESGRIDTLHVHVHDDVAIALGDYTAKMSADGKDFSGTYAFTDTFKNQGGRWVVVASQESKRQESKPQEKK